MSFVMTQDPHDSRVRYRLEGTFSENDAAVDGMRAGPGRTLVIGLGNPLVSDDSVGLRVVERLRPLLADREGVDVVEDYWGGLRLMEQMIGYSRAVVIDATYTGAAPGTIHHLSTDSIATQKSASAPSVASL